MEKLFIKFLPDKIKDYYLNNLDDVEIKSKLKTIVLFIILMLSFAFVFILLTEKMSHNKMVNFDDFITNQIVFYRSPHLNIIMKYITFIGDIFGYIALCIILGLFFSSKKIGEFLYKSP
jgi:ABC-type Na+ efflux pump permease subunit